MSPTVKNALTRDKLAYGIGPAVPTDRSVRNFLMNQSKVVHSLIIDC